MRNFQLLSGPAKDIKMLNEPFAGVIVRLFNLEIGVIADDPDNPDISNVEIKYDYEVIDYATKQKDVDFTKEALEDELGDIIKQVLLEAAGVTEPETTDTEGV